MKNRSVVAVKFVPTNVVQCFNNETILQKISCSRKQDEIDLVGAVEYLSSHLARRGGGACKAGQNFRDRDF